jgi:membrane protease subunit HflK
MIAQESKERIQDILNSLESGIWVENVNLQEVNPPAQVLAAFDDVNSSLQDKERIINTAMRYYNDVVPRSQGEASRILQQAEGYMEVQILKAEGDVVRFEMILDEYEKSPEITKERLYIEMMETILPNARKLVLSGADNGLLKLLNIQELLGGGGL